MKKIVYILFLVAVVGSSCKKSFLSELANNPNSPTDAVATVQQVLPGTITNLTNIVTGVGYSGGYQGQAAWVGYWNFSGGYSFNQTVQEYVVTNASPQVWDNYYGTLANLNVIVQKGGASVTLANYKDIALILESIAFKNLVDAYGDVPFSQALKGSGNFHPSYDKGSAIYDSLVAKLDAVMTEIQANKSNLNVLVPGSEDVLFNGKMNSWLLLANTVKLKLLVQQSAVSSKQAYIKAEASNTQSIGYLSSDAIANPGYSGAQQGEIYGNFGVSTSGGLNGTFNYIRAGGYAMDFYKNSNDPRLGYFYGVIATQPTDANGDYYTQSASNTDYAADYLGIQKTTPALGSPVGPGIVQSPKQGDPLILAAESYFVQSEAVLRGYITGDAKALYQSGITASYKYLGVANADAAATTYYSQDAVTNVSWPTLVNDQISTVITQKWAALNGLNCAEAWNDWRRTGFPNVPATKSPTSVQKHMPFRYFYPTSEPTANADAWKAAGGDVLDPYQTKLFWMP